MHEMSGLTNGARELVATDDRGLRIERALVDGDAGIEVCEHCGAWTARAYHRSDGARSLAACDLMCALRRWRWERRLDERVASR